jgi:hypothetical protein
MDISFALLREGTSDEGLAALLRELLVASGFDRVSGLARAYRGTSAEKLAALQAEDSDVQVVFVHRDADSRAPDPRRSEIVAASAHFSGDTIPIVPIQATEAWLLVDEAAIRTVAGKPNSRVDIGLPALRQIENLSDPKKCLREALVRASETTGRRRREQVNRFSTNRRLLLERLDPNGPVASLPSWQVLRSDVADFASRCFADQR